MPKYIADTPHGDDFFKIHSQIASTVADIIKKQDVSSQSFTFGLLGEWGSGKSLTISKLKDKLKNEKNVLYIEFDIWKYIDTSLYRSILIDLEKDLQVKAHNNEVPESFKNGYKSEKGEKLFDLLYSHSEFTIQSNDPLPTKREQRIKEWDEHKVKKYFSPILLKPHNLLCLIRDYLKKRVEIVLLAAVFVIAILGLYLCRHYFYIHVPFTNSVTFKFITKLFIASVLGVAALEFLKEFFKDAYKELSPKAPKNILITSPPTFAQDQFEAIFRDIIKKVSEKPKKKIIIVFDNIDRCEAEVTLKILTGLKTFLDVPNCFYLIPCDDGRIKEHLNVTAKSKDDFLDKIFQAYLRIPILSEENKVEFIEKCLTEAAFDFSKEDKNKITQILTLAYKGNTPRQIKRFCNDFVTYYSLAKTIDPNKKFLLKDIPHFTFMVTIKQKWPEVEQILISNPNVFNNYHAKQSTDTLPPDFQQYLDTCIGWIDLESNPADFVYLTNANQTGSNIEKILLENFDGFILNLPLIKEFDVFLSRMTRQGRHIFLERGIERLMQITKKHLDEKEKLNGIELFKVYTKHVLSYDGMGFEGKKQSYILSHNPFFIDYCSYISQIEKNKISEFEIHASKTVRQTGFSDVTSRLYSAFVKQFKKENIVKLFENPTAEELTKLNGFVGITDPETALSIIPVKYFELLSKTLGFNKNETAILNIFKPFVNSQELSAVRQSIAVALDQTFAAIYNTAGPHPHDVHVLESLTILNATDFNATNKNSLSTYIQTRITHLFQHVGPDQAIDYFIQFIRLALNNPHSLIQNGHLNTPPNFTKLLEKIPSDVLESALQDASLKEQIFSIAKTSNVLPTLYSKISDEYLKTKINTLYYNHLNSLTGVLDEIIKRKDKISENDLQASEKNILEAYSQGNFELFAGNFEVIIPKITFRENKDNLIEKVFKYFNSNPSQNYPQILKVLNFIEVGMGLNYVGSVIDTVTPYLEDSFVLDKQVSSIGVLNKFEKKHFTKEQSQKINSFLSEIHFEDLNSENLLSELKRKLDFNIKTADKIDFDLNTQPAGDHAHNMLLNLNKFKYEITVTPKEGVNFWRYGIKLANNRDINTQRIQGGVKLFHLTKNKDSDSLFVTFYDQNAAFVYPQPGDKLIKKNYSTEPITFELSQNENGVQISIRDKDQQPLLTEPLGDNSLSYCRLLAWADNSTFDIRSNLKRIPISKN